MTYYSDGLLRYYSGYPQGGLDGRNGSPDVLKSAPAELEKEVMEVSRNMSVSRSRGKLKLFAIFFSMSLWLSAGVRREVQNWYVQNYKNKAMFLKVPIRGTRQFVYVTSTRPILDPRTANLPLLFKVGDQVRITDVSFKGDSIRFKVASIDIRTESEIVFQFPQQLNEEFPQQGNFDVTLLATFTEGLSYTDIESAKEQFITSQFDQFVQQLARSNSTSSDFVIRTLGQEFPEYQRIQEEANQAESKLQEVEQTLLEETKARRQVQSELARFQEELDQTRIELITLKGERESLSAEIKSAQQQTVDFRKSAEDYEQQIRELVENLSLKTSSASSLNAQVRVLNESIETLRQEQVSRSRKLDQVTTDLKKLQGRNQELSQELKQAQDERDKVWGNLSALTSNRKGLEARYMAIQQEKEALQDAALLSNSLHLEKRLENREEGLFQLADLYLLSQHIATFEIQVPPYSGTVHPVRFSVKSPDIVRFSEEEREIFEILGDTLKVETSWQSSSNALKFVLLNKEPLQTAGPRETVEWPWLVQGEISQPEQASLITHLVSPEGREIFLGSQDFTVNPGQVMARVRQSFSPLSLLAGVVLAIAVFGVLFGFRGRSRSPATKPIPRRDWVVQKKL